MPENTTATISSLSCPHCGKVISMEDLFDHNKSQFDDFINIQLKTLLVKEKTKFIEQAKTDRELLEARLDSKFQHELNSLKFRHQDELDKTNKSYQALQSEMAILQGTVDLKLANKEEEVKNNLHETIAELNNQISNLKLQINNQTESFNVEKDNLQTKAALELANQAEIVKNQYLETIAQLKNELIAQEVESKNAKENYLKDKETLLERQQLEFAQREEVIKNSYFDEIAKLKEKLVEQSVLLETKDQEKEKDLEMLRKQNELTNAEEMRKMADELNLQIDNLKKENFKNRILNNKTKGENWEHEVENELRKAFGYLDQIEKITTGLQKADYLQIINHNDKKIGKIVYEVKNAKWSDSWLPKLSVDVANNKTKYGILVTTSFSEKYKGDISFIQSEEYPNIWIADPWSFIFVAQIIRRLIIIENNYADAEKKLFARKNESGINEIDRDILRDYQKMIVGLKEYMTNELPTFIKTFNKQLKDINGVKNSLITNATKLEKTYDMLSRKFTKQIKEKLEKLSGIRIVEDEYNDNEIDVIPDLLINNEEAVIETN